MMNNALSISLLQYNPVWEDATQNMEILNRMFEKIPATTNVIILPEMCLTGFSMNLGKVSQSMDGTNVKWMINKAIERKATLIGTLPITENEKTFNRLLVISPSGSVKWYDKRHLFRMGEEHLFYSAGNSKLIENVNGCNILPLICYDLRFPVWSRNVNCEYDLLVYVANWPASRREAYLTLLKARAIENLCYVAAVNRIGTDGTGINYVGDTIVVDPKGNIVGELAANTEGILDYSIDLQALATYRQKFPAHLDSDQFVIN